jgi:ribose transport system substrate-binding protein
MVTSIKRSTRAGLLAAAVVAVASLTACGSSGNSGSSGSTGSSTNASNAATVISATAAELQKTSGKLDSTAFCGTKQIKLGIHDGLGINAWSKASYAVVRSEAARCPNVTQIVGAGGGDVQKTISDINGMVAQGINALVAIPDFGAAQLPALRKATQAGVKVVAWAAAPGGTANADYMDYVDWNQKVAGQRWMEWMAKAIDDKGNIVFLGGPPGTSVSQDELSGIKEELANHPNIRLLTGTKNYAITNWDPAQAQKTMAALLAKYPKIDGAIIDYGASAEGAIRAFQQANRPLIPIGTTEGNSLGCTFKKLKPANPKFELATFSSRNWLGRVAARKAIAAAAGVSDKEPSIFELSLIEDSLAGTAPKCDPSQGPDTAFSSAITPAELSKYGNTK